MRNQRVIFHNTLEPLEPKSNPADLLTRGISISPAIPRINFVEAWPCMVTTPIPVAFLEPIASTQR